MSILKLSIGAGGERISLISLSVDTALRAGEDAPDELLDEVEPRQSCGELADTGIASGGSIFHNSPLAGVNAVVDGLRGAGAPRDGFAVVVRDASDLCHSGVVIGCDGAVGGAGVHRVFFSTISTGPVHNQPETTSRGSSRTTLGA
jgi:hypothetical protein